MSDLRFRVGLAVSCLWVAFMAWVLMKEPAVLENMTPNEWGDFLAGCFAPLAFLWLVLGYLQQGQELQLSTQALQLQAEELKNSVQQQRELVEVTRQQVESDREALQLERLARLDAAKPIFIVQSQGACISGDGKASYNIIFSNAGNTARNVVGTIEGLAGSCVLIELSVFASTSAHAVVISTNEPFPKEGARLTIHYLDADGRPGKCIFKVALFGGGLSFREIEA